MYVYLAVEGPGFDPEHSQKQSLCLSAFMYVYVHVGMFVCGEQRSALAVIP